MKYVRYAGIGLMLYRLLASGVDNQTIAKKRKDLLIFFQSQNENESVEALRVMSDHEIDNMHEIIFSYGGPNNPKVPVEKINLYLLIIKKYELF